MGFEASMVWKSADRLIDAHRRVAGLALVIALCACGGAGDSGANGGIDPRADTEPAPPELSAVTVDAVRFLTQATFGPSDAELSRVLSIGQSAWIDEQIAKPPDSHRAEWDATAAETTDPTNAARAVLDSFYRQALAGDGQLRQRVAFALSEIFVISMAGGSVAANPRGVAGYLDTLARGAFGNFRDLLQDVSLHPMMGVYLSHLHNQKENAATGRAPDENYAREVMQLFTIGLHRLHPDGSVQTEDGKPLETYTADDISGLAKVFTGWSWFGTNTSDARFFGRSNARDPDRQWKAMMGYDQFHSTLEKRFLGKTVAPQGSPDPEASLKVALDALHQHPNVGPFIGKQLIQRLVTSNPTPAYIARVAAAFDDNGAGVRGDMRAVVRAALLDTEARQPVLATDTRFGKLREPVLRLTAFLRAFGAQSDSGRFLVGFTDDPARQLGQSPLRSPSVFNFFRPGYVPPNTQAGGLNLAVPEMQITNETTVAGYANYMRSAVQSGVGLNGTDRSAARRDVQPDYREELAVADQSAVLVHRVTAKLITGPVPRALRNEIEAAVRSIPMPALRSDGRNQRRIDDAKLNRVRLAVYLTLVSPEFIVQK
jgi:uncharacterized protein (DUF1800 family)